MLGRILERQTSFFLQYNIAALVFWTLYFGVLKIQIHIDMMLKTASKWSKPS